MAAEKNLGPPGHGWSLQNSTRKISNKIPTSCTWMWTRFSLGRASAQSQAARQARAGGTRLCGFGELRSEVSRRENGDEFSRSAAHLPESHRRAGNTSTTPILPSVCGASSKRTHRGRDRRAGRFLPRLCRTERLYPDYEATLLRLQAEIRARTGLSVSVGAARTKVSPPSLRGWSDRAGFA